MRGIMDILWNIKSPQIQTVMAEFNDSSDSETDIKKNVISFKFNV